MLTLSQKYGKLAFCMAAISLILIIRDIVGLGIPDMVVTAVFVISMAVLRYEEMVYLIFFIFPIMCGAPGYIISIAYILLLIKGPRLTARQFVPLLIVTVLEVINELLRNLPGLYTGMLSFLAFTAVFFYFLDERSTQYSVEKCLIAYGLGATFVFIVIYANMFLQYGAESMLSGMFRSGALGVVDNDMEKMRGHIALNANTIAYMATSVVSIFSVMSIMLKEAPNKKLFYVIITCICLAAGVFSFSRTYVAVMLLLVFFLLFETRGKKKIKLAFLLLLICAVALYLFKDTLNSVFDVFEGRMEEDNIATGGGRTILFSLYNKAWEDNLFYVLFGVGTVSYREVLQVYNAMHSGLQQIWVCLGIIGFLLYAIRLVGYLKRVYTPKSSILYAPFIVTFIFDQSIQFLNPYPFVLILLATLQLPKIKLEKDACCANKIHV